MSLKLKLAGLGVLACIAAVAMTVVSASAENREGHFTTTGTKIADVLGTEGGTHFLEWTAEGLPNGVVCDKSTWQDRTEKETENTLIFFPTFAECHTTKEIPKFEVKTNGCAIWFFDAKEANNETEQTAKIDCIGKPIEIRHPGCTVKVPSQDNLTKLTYTTITLNEKHAITMHFNVKLSVETEGACGVAKKFGTLEGSLTVEAVDLEGKQANLTFN